MAMLPSYVRILLDGYSEDSDPSVERTEMEEGFPRQRIVNSDIRMTMNVNLIFERKEYAQMFWDWYRNDIDRIEFFQIRHPRTRELITVRFVGGKIGAEMPVKGGFGITTRQCQLEYLS